MSGVVKVGLGSKVIIPNIDFQDIDYVGMKKEMMNE